MFAYDRILKSICNVNIQVMLFQKIETKNLTQSLKQLKSFIFFQLRIGVGIK